MVVFEDLPFNLSVGDFRGTLVEQPGARHDDSVLRIYFDKFANVGRSFFEDPCHFDVVVGGGSGALEDELELALRGVGIVIADFPGFFLLACFIASFMASMRLKGFSISSGLLLLLLFFEKCLEGCRGIWGVWQASGELVFGLWGFGGLW